MPEPLPDRVATYAGRFIDWLRRAWQIATIPERERCSACSRRGVVHETITETGEAGITRRWVTRYCTVCLRRAEEEPSCDRCGRPFWPAFPHAGCDPAAAEADLHIFPWRCPMCVGGLVLGPDGEAVERCLHCAGSGLTNDPCGPAELAPRPPGVMRTACADCALRPGSPELENAGVVLPYEEPFFCHQGVYVSASGRYEPVATFRGLPLGLMVCAGWWAMRTEQAMPTKPYREVPITEDEVAKRWGPKPAGEPT
ncbi:hypothetical protein ACRYCC_26150 [Actinomadura scrupuli]|uniref:hypothetical protein n=1 Tax=Actinomadura scrupuli TaxID=559629 RepID=UPI003D95F84A